MEEEARGRAEADPPALALALASPVAAAARKTVRMSAVRDVIIPDYTTTAADDDQGSFAIIAEEEEEGSGSAAGSSVSAEASAAAAVVRGALYRHGSGAGSPPPPGIPCEGALQDTPDYIRRSTARHRGVAPLELFSAAASSPRPGRGSCAAAEAVVIVAATGAEGQTTVGGVPVVRAILQPKEEVESSSCGQLRQQYACCGHASIWLGSSVIPFEHDFSCPVMLLGY